MAAKKVNCKSCKQKFPSKAKLDEHVKAKHTEVKKKNVKVENKSPVSQCKKITRSKRKKPVRGAANISLAKAKKSLSKALKATVVEEEPIVSEDSSPEEKKPQLENECDICHRGFATPRGLKKHQSACKPDDDDLEIRSEDEEDSCEHEHEETCEHAEEETNENGTPASTLRAQMRGKFSHRVKSLLNVAQNMRHSSRCQCCKKEIYGSVGSPERLVFKCDKCPAVFKLKSSVDRHKKVLHMEGPSHVCNECGARCADKGTLARHQYTHTGLKPFQCKSCKRQFSRKYHLDRHLIETKCGGNNEIPTFTCVVCLKVFSRKSNLREHMKSHAGESKNKTFTCEFCHKEFTSYSLMQIHIRKHTGEKPFQCDYCEKTFPSTGAVKKHRRIHTGERPYECSECGAKFALKGTLNRHVRIHTGIKPHKCHFCGKQFIQSGGLKAHLFHHTGENGFQCEFCNKSFNRKARLQMHIKYIHEKAKPYQCDVCQKAFVRKEDLNRHAVLHTGVKAYVCPTCNKSFAIKPSLKLHLLTHTKEEPKSCNECGRAFIRQDCLLRHMRKRHREMLEKIIQDAEKYRIRNVEPTSERILTEAQLAESIRELLSLLVDEPTLLAFGWPDKPVDQLLEAVIRRCGHTPVNPEDFSFMDRLRENSKLLFTVVIDDNAVRTLLNNQTVDEVILHVLRLAKA